MEQIQLDNSTMAAIQAIAKQLVEISKALQQLNSIAADLKTIANRP